MNERITRTDEVLDRHARGESVEEIVETVGLREEKVRAILARYDEAEYRPDREGEGWNE